MNWVWVLVSTLLAVGVAAKGQNELPGCPPGFTGPQCESPICTSQIPPYMHDGGANYGDTVALWKSQTCTDMLTFFVDNFIGDFYVSVTSSVPNVFPDINVYDPNGASVELCSITHMEGNQMIIEFCSIKQAHGQGLYTVKLASQTDGDCTVRVTSQTTLSIDGGFVTDVRDDHCQTNLPSPNQAIARFPKQFVSSYLAFRVQNDIYPVHPETVHIFIDGQWNQQYDLVARYGCSFPHITKLNFTCTDLKMYHAEFIGIDDGGNTWQRVYDFACDAAAVTAGPTGTGPTRSPIDECLNGGILDQGVCYCGEYYEGDQCEWPLCMNGGTYNIRTDTCLCATGWSGQHCEHVKCKYKSEDNFDEYSRALGFVIRSVGSMQAQLDQIAKAAQQIANQFKTQRPGYFKAYVLSVVQNNAILFTHEYPDSKSFVNAIQNLIHPPADTVCSDALLLGVGEVIDTPSFKQYPNSPIFIFSDGVMNDGMATVGYVYQQLGYTRAQLFFMLTDSASGMCNVDISSEGYQSLINFAGYTQGLVVKTDLNALADTTTNLTATLWQPAQMAGNDLMDCRKAPAFQPFFVDDSISTLYISATGENLTLSLTQPDMTTTQPAVYFTKGNLHIWVMNKPMMGAYMLNLVSAVSVARECSWRVYSPSTYMLYYGASTDMITDRSTKNPVVGQESHIVARVDNLYFPDSIDVSAEVTLWGNDITSGRIILYSSSGLFRDGCQYDLYFGSIACHNPGMGFYVTVYITDANGQTVMRTTTGYCTAGIPTDPSEVCQNGGALFNGTCVCPSHFSGAKCQQINCENQGTPLYAACQCPPGFSGQFCEITACSAFNTYVQVDFDHRSLTFLMHDTITTRSVFRTVNDVAPRVIHDIVHQHPNWILNYNLLRFNDTSYSTYADSSNPEDFITGLNQLYVDNQAHSDYSCQNLDLYATLFTALKSKVQFGGIVYIFLYGTPRADSDSYDKILTHVQDTYIQINIVQMSLNPCGNDYTQDGLMSLAQATGGTYMLSSGPNAGNVMKSLPSNYESGLVYERFVTDCTDTTFYVPVDSGVQSFTAYIQGELDYAPIYIKPDGKVADYLTVSNVWSDIGSDSRMDQVIQTCDPGWTLNDGHCWVFVPQPADWQTAKSSCTNLGAALATIYNKAEQTFLNGVSQGAQFWIGLNDIKDYNQWVWDLPNNQTLSLTSTGYPNWAPNEPAQDESKRCALDDNKNTNQWIASNCAEKHNYACVKDTYNTEFEPTSINDNLVQRGIWQIRVRADGACSLNIRAQSKLQIINMYNTNIHSDFGISEPIQGTSNNRLIAHVTGLDPDETHSLEYAHMYSDDGTMIQVQNIAHRVGCMMDYMSTAFHCPANNFQMMLTGTDSAGNLYQRVIPVTCLGGAKPDSCENGGTYYKGACVCPPNYYGEMCEIIFCQNGGAPGANLGQCVCPVNFTGKFCELPICTRGGIVPDVNTEGRTFVLALDGSNSGNMKDVLGNINNILASVLKNTNASHPGWFTHFVAVVFRDSSSGAIPLFSKSIVDTDYMNWITQIQAELTANPFTSAKNTRAIFAGLSQALSHPTVNEGSFAFVLTASAAEDTSNENLLQTIVAGTHSSINMIFIGDKTAPGGLPYNQPAVNDLFETAHYSGGSVYQLASAAGLTNQWTQILGTLHHSYYVISHHIDNCQTYSDYLQLGANGTEVIVDLFSQGGPTVSVVNTDGQQETAIPLVTSATNVLTEFTQVGMKPGIWTISLDAHGTNTGQCMFNMRGLSDVEVLVAFTQDVQTDGGLHDGSAVAFPRADYNANAVVATVSSGAVLTTVQIFDVEERNLLWASSLQPRSMCSYSYISNQIFRCDRPTFILAVDGLDVIGHPFRRMFTFHCQGLIYTRPPMSPTPPLATSQAPPTTAALPTCDPSVPKADIVLAFDSSSTIDAELFQMTVAAFRPLIDSVQVGADKTRLLIGTYDSDAHFDSDDLNTVSDAQSFGVRMAQIATLGYTGVDGNNIDGVLEYLYTVTHANTPFRANPVRKIVVLISSIGWNKGNFFNGMENGFIDPTADVTQLKTQSVEFFPVAFGSSANMTQLAALSTKCLQTANSPDDMKNIVNIIASNLCQSTPQC